MKIIFPTKVKVKKRIRSRANRKLYEALHDEINKQTWETLDKILKLRKNVNLNDDLTRTLDGLVWAYKERDM